ncbi:MAG: GNAT family N-acetyltransferase [Flavobacteriaceae bacterium]
MPIKFYPKEYNHLTKDELYEILRLRSEVFVVEQNCVYQDIDDKDQIAMHILGYVGIELVAYARIFKPGDYVKKASIGRVLVREKHRQNVYGFRLMETSIMAINMHFRAFKIEISAQEHLKKFYNRLGFIQIGDNYLEDGIPHIKMIK